MKHSTRYLYNCSPLWFMFMPYIFALYFKKYMARRNMKRIVKVARLLDIHDECYPQYRASEKAEEFNQKLIEEVKYEFKK